MFLSEILIGKFHGYLLTCRHLRKLITSPKECCQGDGSLVREDESGGLSGAPGARAGAGQGILELR